MNGTQALSRAAGLLRIVGDASPRGLSTAEVAGLAALALSTTYRILSGLASEGLLDHNPTNNRWYLGPELYLLGLRAAPRFDVTQFAAPVVRELADVTGESAFFSSRRGMESVCLIREEGSFPLRSFVLDEGVRFPLGVASAGMVMAAFLDEEELSAFLSDEPLIDRYGPQHRSTEVLRRAQLTREHGYSLNPGLVLEGSWGMAAAVFSTAGEPEWALSVTGVESRFKPARQEEIGALLIDRAHRLSIQLQRRPH